MKLIFLLLCISIGATSAETVFIYKPKLKNSKSGAIHDFPLGVLSATGRLEDGDRGILITDVGKAGAAAQSGIQVGDRIVKIAGNKPKAFSKSTDTGLEGPQTDLGTALDKACAASTPKIALEIERDGKSVPLKIELPRSKAFASTFPDNCPKSDLYLGSIANHLVATQREDGSWKPGVGGDADVYLAAFCGLALLADDDKAKVPAVKKAIEFINRKSNSQINLEDVTKGPKNWQASTSAILLAEYQLATGDDRYFADLKKCCDYLAARVSANGTMGHNYDIPYGGGGLVIINVQAHLAWALAEKCGYEIDKDAWDRSLEEVEKSIDKKTGAIGYSSRAPGSPDIAARTGAMAAALAVAGREKRLARQFAKALVEYEGRMRHAHAMSSIGLIYGFAGIKGGDPRGHAKVLKKWIPYLELARTAAGPATFFGGKRNIGGDEYLGLHPIGNTMVALMLASAEEKLFMFGGMRKAWLASSVR